MGLPAHAAKLYKWVDENGNVYYSDKVPPEQAGKETSQLNPQGVVVEHSQAAPDPAKLKEEARHAEEEKARHAEEAARAAEQAKYDRMLTDTFLSLEDMARVRDQRLAAIEGAIQLAEARVERLKTKLEQNEKQIAYIQKRGGEVPQSIQDSVTQLNTQLAENETFIADKREERARVAIKFDADMKRFKEIQEEKARAAAAAAP